MDRYQICPILVIMISVHIYSSHSVYFMRQFSEKKKKGDEGETILREKDQKKLDQSGVRFRKEI